MTDRRSDTRATDGPRSAADEGRDPGAFIGHEPEGAEETIPGGVGRRDERVAAHSTQPAPVRGPSPAAAEGEPPSGHREGARAGDDDVREAGQDR
jgi:hypothetical protein